MKNLLAILSFLFISFFWSTLATAESTLPIGCQPLAVQGEGVSIEHKKNVLVLIHNLSMTDLWITHPSNDSTHWTSKIQSDHWSALAVVDKSPLVLNCIESRPGHEQQIPCEGTIAVCQYAHAKIPSGYQNTFWAGEDMSLAALTAAIGAHGFVLPTPKLET